MDCDVLVHTSKDSVWVASRWQYCPFNTDSGLIVVAVCDQSVTDECEPAQRSLKQVFLQLLDRV